MLYVAVMGTCIMMCILYGWEIRWCLYTLYLGVGWPGLWGGGGGVKIMPLYMHVYGSRDI